MTEGLLVYIIFGIAGGLLSTFLCLFAFLKIRHAPGAKYYILATCMCAIFTYGYAFELTSTSLEEIKFWLRIQYLALPFIPVFVLYMCTDYIGYNLPRSISVILNVIPFVTIITHFTNDLHSLYYTSMELRMESPFPIIQLTGGLFFYIHSIFLYACMTLSVGILCVQLKKVTNRFRLQLIMMITGLIVPVIGSVFYLTGLSPHGIDLGPISMSIAFIFHGAALISFQMFNVVPIARHKVFESLQQGMVVLNHNDVIVDYNDAARNIVPSLNKTSIGKSLSNILKEEILKEIVLEETESDYEYKQDGSRRCYQIRFTPVISKSNLKIGRIITFFDVTERVQLQEELHRLASIDGLTQVFNRTFFLKETEQLYAGSGNDFVSIILFDIDHFKNINDTYSHEGGDLVLKSVVNLVKECLRNTDLIGRYGGEEFVIYLPNTPITIAAQMAEAIRVKIASGHVRYMNEPIHVTSSFGVSSIFQHNESKDTITSLIKQADQALYRAKRSGRNRVECSIETSTMPR